MGKFEGDEEEKYRNYLKIIGVGGVVLLLALLLLIFGRAYGFDGTNYDLFFIFGLFFLTIGVLLTAVPFISQIRILYKGVKRQPYLLPAQNPQPSALGQAVRNTQIFSSVAGSSYDGQRGAHVQPQQQPYQFSSAAAFAKGSNDQLAPARPQAQTAPPPTYNQALGATPSASSSSVQAPLRSGSEIQRQLLGHSSEI